jgi:WD40 repeat protein
VWDPRQPGQELARFDGHTDTVWGVAVLPWLGLDHPVVVTTAFDGTARVWDPRQPGQELARYALFGQGISVATLSRTELACASFRGFVILQLETGEPSSE